MKLERCDCFVIICNIFILVVYSHPFFFTHLAIPVLLHIQQQFVEMTQKIGKIDQME